MGGSGDVLLAVGKTRVGGEAGAKFDKVARRAGVDLDGPGGFPGVVQKIRADGVGTLGNPLDGPALVALGDEFEAIADRALGEGLKKGAAEGGCDEGGEGLHRRGGFWEGAKEKGGGRKAAQGVEIVEAKRSDGGKGEKAGPDLHNSEFRSPLLDFLGKDGLEPRSAAEMDAELGKIGKGGGTTDRGGFLLPGKVGFGPLLIEDRKGGALVANQVEGGRAADLLERFAEELFFTVSGSFGKQGEKLALLGAAGADFWQGGHRVAADFFGGIGKKGEEPLTNGLLERGLAGQGEAGTDSANEGDLAEFFPRGCEIEAGDLLLPKTQPRDGAQFPIQVLGELGGLLGHGGASVWRRENSSLPWERT